MKDGKILNNMAIKPQTYIEQPLYCDIKLRYNVWNKKYKCYEGNGIICQFEFFTVANAKKYIKNKNLKNYEIHKIETIVIEKMPEVVK